MVQDISIYFEKCSPFCNSNNCPNIEPYYKDPFSDLCVNDCADGYTEVGDLCVVT